MNRSHSVRLSVVQRIGLAAMGVGLLVLLSLACWLTPSSQGYGTHQQLGLPPCTIVQLLGTRCPACGMTTSWAHLVRGELVAAMGANSGGVLLGLLSVTGVPWLLGSAIHGRWWGWQPSDRGLLAGSLATFGVILADWLVRRWML